MNISVYKLEYICLQNSISEEEVYQWIELEIIHPYDLENMLFDEEDLKRIGFICDLRERCSPNKESLQVILHLLDQVQFLQRKMAPEDE